MSFWRLFLWHYFFCFFFLCSFWQYQVIHAILQLILLMLCPVVAAVSCTTPLTIICTLFRYNSPWAMFRICFYSKFIFSGICFGFYFFRFIFVAIAMLWNKFLMLMLLQWGFCSVFRWFLVGCCWFFAVLLTVAIKTRQAFSMFCKWWIRSRKKHTKFPY